MLVDADTQFFALLESDIISAEAFNQAIGFKRVQGAAAVSVNIPSQAVPAGNFITPWRVILVGDTPGDLLESTVAVNLAAPLALDDDSWIQPGKSLWIWRVLSYRTGDNFTYRTNTASINRMVDFAAENNIQYVLVDDDWYTLIRNGQVVSQASNFNIQEVVAHAESKHVGILLYFDRSPSHRVQNTTDTQLFELYSSLGASGVKYGFKGNDVPFTRGAVRGSANSQLLINFHDSPVYQTGARRTMPNAITREVGWAQQDARRAFTPSDFLKMAMINALSGPFDQTNGIYDLNEIQRRAKGPRNPLNSTVAAENARTLMYLAVSSSCPMHLKSTRPRTACSSS